MVRDELETPRWSPDGNTLWTIGRLRRSQCLYQVDVPTLAAKSLLCFGGKIQLMPSPDGATLLVMLVPDGGSDSRELLFWDVARAQEAHRWRVEGVRGLGRFGVWLDEARVALIVRDASGVQVISTTGQLQRDLDLSTHGTLYGLEGMARSGSELILMRQQPGDEAVEVIGIKILP